MPSVPTKQLTLRLPAAMYQNLRKVAKGRKTSLNRLARESLELLIEQELNAELRAAYDALGEDRDESDVEPFLEAQSQVVNDERE